MISVFSVIDEAIGPNLLLDHLVIDSFRPFPILAIAALVENIAQVSEQIGVRRGDRWIRITLLGHRQDRLPQVKAPLFAKGRVVKDNLRLVVGHQVHGLGVGPVLKNLDIGERPRPPLADADDPWPGLRGPVNKALPLCNVHHVIINSLFVLVDVGVTKLHRDRVNVERPGAVMDEALSAVGD